MRHSTPADDRKGESARGKDDNIGRLILWANSDNGLGLDGLHGDQWSEFAYMVNYLNANLNDTDIIGGTASGDSFWDTWYVKTYRRRCYRNPDILLSYSL